MCADHRIERCACQVHTSAPPFERLRGVSASNTVGIGVWYKRFAKSIFEQHLHKRPLFYDMMNGPGRLGEHRVLHWVQIRDLVHSFSVSVVIVLLRRRREPQTEEKYICDQLVFIFTTSEFI